MLTFNTDEQDCLIELMNMAYGATASAVADTIDAFSTLHVPELKVMDPSELVVLFEDMLEPDATHFVTSQPFVGEIEGEVMFILNNVSANNLVKHLEGTEAQSDSELADAAMELCNIITASTLKNLAESLNTSIELLPPHEFTVVGNNVHNIEGIDKYRHLILISTVMEFNDQNIKGKLLVLAHDEGLNWLKDALNRVLDELTKR